MKAIHRLGVLAVALGVTFSFAGCARHRAMQPLPPPARRGAQALLVASPLNGELVPPRTVRHRVAAVMIDNHPDARPQIGLRDADVIYEAEAEGGITRYMALYLERRTKVIGPVRSARLYFVNFARPYGPLFAHVGENDDVWGSLATLRLQGFADFEQIVGVPDAFWRDWSEPMPHNMYTSVDRLRKYAPRYDWPDRPYAARQFAFSRWRVITDDPPDVKLTFWRQYDVRFHYVHGYYLRYVEDVLQHDRGDRQPYRVADIVVTWMPARIIDAEGDLVMRVFGSFPAVLARDGKFFLGKWLMPGPDIMPRLVDKNGNPIQLTPGQIYIEVLPQGGTLRIGKNVWSYSPSM